MNNLLTLLVLTIFSGFIFADNNVMVAGAGGGFSREVIHHPLKSLKVKVYSYHYKLSLDKINKILASNNIHKLTVTSTMPYKAEIIGGNLKNIDKSLSQDFDPGIYGYSECMIGNIPCQFSGNVITNSGGHFSTTISVYLFAVKNNISARLELFDAFVDKSTKVTTTLESVAGKSYIIISGQKLGHILAGQIILAQFGKQ